MEGQTGERALQAGSLGLRLAGKCTGAAEYGAERHDPRETERNPG